MRHLSSIGLVVISACLASPASVTASSGDDEGAFYGGLSSTLGKQGIGCFLLVSEGGHGLYLDMRSELNKPGTESSFVAGLSSKTAEGWGDTFLREDVSETTLNLGYAWRYHRGAHPVQNSFLLMGIGFSRREVYRKYLDPEGELGNHGQYWVHSGDMNHYRLGGVVAVYQFVAGVIGVQAGLQSNPAGIVVGIGVGGASHGAMGPRPNDPG